MTLLDKPIIAVLSVVVSLAGLVFAPADGLCEVRPSDISIPTNEQGLGPGYGRRTTQFRLELGIFSGSEDNGDVDVESSAILPQFGVVQPVGRNEAEFSMGIMRYGSTTSEAGEDLSASTFRFSNPEFKYFFVWRNLARQFRVGLGFTIPLARLRNEQDEDIRVDYQAMSTALNMEGLKDRWLWSFDTMTALVSADYVGRFASGFIFGAGVVLAPMFNVGDSLGSYAEQGFIGPADYTLIGQAELELAFDAKHLRSSLKVFYSTDTGAEASDEVKNQLVIEPNFRIRLKNVDVLLGFTLPKEAITGSPLRANSFWMLTFGVATSTDLVLPAR